MCQVLDGALVKSKTSVVCGHTHNFRAVVGVLPRFAFGRAPYLSGYTKARCRSRHSYQRMLSRKSWRPCKARFSDRHVACYRSTTVAFRLLVEPRCAPFSFHSFQSLLQDAEIASLRANVAALTAQDVPSVLRSLSHRLAGVEATVEELRRHTALPQSAATFTPLTPFASGSGEGGGGVTLGALLSHAMSRLSAMEHVAQVELVGKAEVRAALKGVEDRCHAAVAASAEACASREAFTRSSEAQSAMASEITALQGVVSTKVDRSDLLRLQTTASELSSFSTWKASASADISTLQSRSEDGRLALSGAVESLGKLSGLIQSLAHTSSLKADR